MKHFYHLGEKGVFPYCRVSYSSDKVKIEILNEQKLVVRSCSELSEKGFRWFMLDYILDTRIIDDVISWVKMNEKAYQV
jgi:hypothetical protein